MMDRLSILGVMTGTSCDGLDAACVEFAPDSWDPSWSVKVEYPKELRKRVLEIQTPGSSFTLPQWLKLDRDLSVWYAETLKRICAKKKVDVIANHGQTVAHHPDEAVTLQMGNPAWITEATGITCISHFREGDIAAGGQGAPLLPRFHRLLANALFEDPAGAAIHNLGGISNFTYFGKNNSILATDTGPGNVWIDAAAELATKGKQRFDRDGKLALVGEPDSEAILAVLEDPYFKRPLPKSTGRDDFPFSKLTKKTRATGADLVATAAWITIESIAQSYAHAVLKKKLPLHTILCCGGGAKNVAVIEGLRARLPGVDIHTLDDAGWDSQLIEAQGFAYLGMLSLMGKPLGGEWTGADENAPTGWITPGKNWPMITRMIERFLDKRSTSSPKKPPRPAKVRKPSPRPQAR